MYIAIVLVIVYISYFVIEIYKNKKINKKIREYEKTCLEEDQYCKFESELTDAQIRYREYLKSPHWQHMREEALKRAGYKCQLCGYRGNLKVHHNNYKNRGHEKLTDLVVLCGRCHSKFHNKSNSI